MIDYTVATWVLGKWRRNAELRWMPSRFDVTKSVVDALNSLCFVSGERKYLQKADRYGRFAVLLSICVR